VSGTGITDDFIGEQKEWKRTVCDFARCQRLTTFREAEPMAMAELTEIKQNKLKDAIYWALSKEKKNRKKKQKTYTEYFTPWTTSDNKYASGLFKGAD
jgi:hypothetical protein